MTRSKRAIELLALCAAAPSLIVLAAASAGLSAGIAVLRRLSR